MSMIFGEFLNLVWEHQDLYKNELCKELCTVSQSDDIWVIHIYITKAACGVTYGLNQIWQVYTFIQWVIVGMSFYQISQMSHLWHIVVVKYRM